MYFKPQPKPSTKRLHGAKRTRLRKEVYERDKGRCYDCGRYAPLLYNGFFDVHICGHLSHIVSVGAGGEDTKKNTVWKCSKCHFREHGPRWSGNETDFITKGEI